jgi:hypothetical protein
MMYLALSYDHRIIDGREAVLFLVRVKECIEDPSAAAGVRTPMASEGHPSSEGPSRDRPSLARDDG